MSEVKIETYYINYLSGGKYDKDTILVAYFSRQEVMKKY
jgi:hypothetical protein